MKSFLKTGGSSSLVTKGRTVKKGKIFFSDRPPREFLKREVEIEATRDPLNLIIYLRPVHNFSSNPSVFTSSFLINGVIFRLKKLLNFMELKFSC